MSYGPNNPDPMNPYGPGSDMSGIGRDYALTKVKGPAIAMLVTAALAIVLQIGGLLYSLAVGNAPPQVPPDADPQVAKIMEAVQQFSGPVGMVMGLVSIVIAVVIVVGALKMMKLESYGLAMTSAILSLLPCNCPCCLLSMPFGIWAIMALNDTGVKTSFR